MKVLFKRPVLEGQFKALLVKNPQLVFLVLAWARAIGEITITEIKRTNAMQRKYYPEDPNKVSVHQSWRGVDVRITDVKPEIYTKVAADLNLRYPYDAKRPQLKTFLIHDIGQGMHLHIQNLNA